MKIRPVSPHGRQLTTLGFVNAYLVREDDDTLTLIDTMLGNVAPDVLAAAAAEFGAPIRRILLTHAHSDHIGALDSIAAALAPVAAQFGPTTIAIGQRESLMLPRPPAQNLDNLPGETGKPGMRMNFPGALTPPTHLLTPGELFGSLRCLATPGHTPGHLSYLDERDGTLYTGDALVTVGGAPHVPGFGPWYFPFPRFATWNRQVSVTSIQTLLTQTPVPIERLAPGHGSVLTGGTSLLTAALAETK